MGREEHCKYHWCVGSACSVWATLGLRPLPVCVLSVCTAQAPGCSARELSKVGSGLRALPRSKPLRFRFLGTPQRRRLGWACILCPSQVRAAQVTGCLASALSPGGGASYRLPSPSPSVSWVCSGSAISGVPISDCDPPGGCQPSRIPERLG